MKLQSISALLGLPPRTRAVIAANLVSSVGTGLVQPFLVLYLTKVRDIPVGTATSVVAVIAAASVVGGPLAGRLADGFSLRATAIGAMALAAVGTGAFAFAFTAWEAAAAGVLYGVAQGAMFSVWNTAMAMEVKGEMRATAFGMQFVGLNIGVGLGGMLGGLFASTSNATSFQGLYLANACIFVMAGCVLATVLRGGPSGTSGPSAPDAKTHSARGEGDGTAGDDSTAGYGEVLRDPKLLRVLALTVLLMIVGYGQLESSIPGLVSVMDIDARVMAWAFVANTICIVLIQLLAITRLTRIRPPVLLAGTAASWTVCWSLLLLTEGTQGAASAALVIGGVAVFAVGEALLAVSLPTLVNSLATDRLRGRYNGAYSGAMSAGLVLGPLLGGQLLASGHTWLLSVVLGLGAAGCVAYALRLGRHLPAAEATAEGGGPSARTAPGVEKSQVAREQTETQQADKQRAEAETGVAR